MVPLKVGPLSVQDLMEIWSGAVDAGYRDPIVAAGEGHGLEVHTQAHAQYARVSEAIDRTTQAMFILPYSGQTHPPASGGRKAQVVLTFERDKRYVHWPLVLGAGLIQVEEETNDWSENGFEPVLTERRYVLKNDLVFQPGDTGPFDVDAEAEAIGDGYNNPAPGSIKSIVQAGASFENTRASVTVQLAPIVNVDSTNTVMVTTPNHPDTFVPEHVGQYMLFTAGSNVGKLARIIQFIGPDLSVFPAIGSRVILEWAQSVEGVVVGTFVDGETITRTGLTLYGTVQGVRGARMTYVLRSTDGTPITVGDVLTGATSGATMTVASVLSGQDFVNETDTAGWRIMDWSVSWQLTATNALQPAGGVHSWLDELGFERNFQRAPNEDDETYRQRISTIADVVTPNAIRRNLARTMWNIPWCFREVGTEEMPGWFYDGNRAPVGSLTTLAAADLNDAYDTDVIIFTVIFGSGTFEQDEKCVVESPSGDVYVSGYFGSYTGGPFILNRTNGHMRPSLLPLGLNIRGVHSGAIVAVTAYNVPTSVARRRFRYALDYAQFRGFFLIGVPRLGLGEFGFPYDEAPANAFDYIEAYDGFPRLNPDVYLRVYQAINQVKAGGVGFELYLEEIGCP